MLDANRNLSFGWARSGTGVNECEIASSISTSQWYGIYVAHKGARYSASDATATNLANAFDIRVMSTGDSFASVSASLSTSSNWTSTGNNMARTITGDFTIGGRGSNRNFHGKVASMVVTTLMINVDMPTDAEIKLMITDPVKWVTDYKVGNTFRYADSNSLGTFAINQNASCFATQVWLMGDVESDSYSNGMRNYIQPYDQNYTKLQLNSMQSNDMENVTIPGLS
jgi:hypothetical protein